MKKLAKVLFMLIPLLIVACDNDKPVRDASGVIGNSVSFKEIANMWFEQAEDAEPPTPNGLDIVYDADGDESVFDNLLATQQSGELKIP